MDVKHSPFFTVKNTPSFPSDHRRYILCLQKESFIKNYAPTKKVENSQPHLQKSQAVYGKNFQNIDLLLFLNNLSFQPEFNNVLIVFSRPRGTLG